MLDGIIHNSHWKCNVCHNLYSINISEFGAQRTYDSLLMWLIDWLIHFYSFRFCMLTNDNTNKCKCFFRIYCTDSSGYDHQKHLFTFQIIIYLFFCVNCNYSFHIQSALAWILCVCRFRYNFSRTICFSVCMFFFLSQHFIYKYTKIKRTKHNRLNCTYSVCVACDSI